MPKTFIPLCLLAALSSPALAAAATQAPMDASAWIIAPPESYAPHDPAFQPHAVRFTTHLGRPSLDLTEGFAYLRGVELGDGVIDADLATDDKRPFLGLAFHVQSAEDFEVVYLRNGGSGTDQALQYTPNFKGAIAWQLYAGAGATASADFPSDRWFHLRIVIAGRRATVYVGDMDKPALVVPELKLGDAAGSIGFWGTFGGGGYLSDLRYQAADAPKAPPAAPAYAPGTIQAWELSPAYAVTEHDPGKYPDLGAAPWERVQAESPGMVVINRYRRSPEVIGHFGSVPLRSVDQRLTPRPGVKVVFARAFIDSDRTQVKRLALGYSDEVTVFLNGVPLFAGKAAYGYREPENEGYMNMNDDAVYLPLKQGRNELMLAVSEYFGGWGYICAFDDLDGLRLVEPKTAL